MSSTQHNNKMIVHRAIPTYTQDIHFIICVNSVTVSYLIRYDSFLQNAADVITKCDVYYKMRQYFYLTTWKIQKRLLNCKESFLFL